MINIANNDKRYSHHNFGLDINPSGIIEFGKKFELFENGSFQSVSFTGTFQIFLKSVVKSRNSNNIVFSELKNWEKVEEIDGNKYAKGYSWSNTSKLEVIFIKVENVKEWQFRK